MSKTVQLNWVDPSTRVNGDPLAAADIDAVIVSMSADNGATFTELTRVPAGAQTASQADLPDGTYKFRVVVGDKQTPQKFSAPVDIDVVVVTVVVLADPSPVSSLTSTVI